MFFLLLIDFMRMFNYPLIATESLWENLVVVGNS